MDIATLFLKIGLFCFLWNLGVLWIFAGMNAHAPNFDRVGRPVFFITGCAIIIISFTFEFMESA